MVNSQRPPGENAPAPHMEIFGECRGKGKDILISKGHQYKDCTFFMTYHATAIYHRNMYIYISIHISSLAFEGPQYFAFVGHVWGAAI